MASVTSDAYRSGPFDASDVLFRRCLIGSSLCGLLFLVAVLLAPIQKQVITRLEQLPPRFARLILDKPVPKALPAADIVKPPGGSPGEPGAPGPKELEPAAPKPATPEPAPLAGRPDAAPGPGPGSGSAGRERAQQVVAARLASTTASLQQSLAGLSSSLQTTTAGSAPGRRSYVRTVRSGRSDHQLTAFSTDLAGATPSADLGGSTVGGSWVAIGSLSRAGGTGGGGGDGGGAGGGRGSGGGGGADDGGGGGGGGGSGSGWGRGSGPGAYRSNASLLAVIQKYAAGIQYCYGNELKRRPGLSGKLVVALSVTASGEVLEATIVQDTVGSGALSACALSQIRGWKFPPIPEGTTTFQAPFIFTPPN